MKPTRLAVVSVGLLILNVVLAGTASATPVVACQTMFSALRDNTLAVRSSFTSPDDFMGSIKQLDSVWPRLADVKHPYVEEDLTAFQTRLTGLAGQAKFDPAAAQRLNAQAQDVIDCANTLDVPPP